MRGKSTRRRVALAVAIAIAIGSTSCRHAPAERARVVVSIFPLFDLTRRIAGPDADVALALPPTSSPYDATTPSDPSLANARLYVLVGFGLDAWMRPIAKAGAKSRVLEVGDRVPTISIGDAIEPHVWLDPQRARLVATAIAEELARVDGSHATAFRQRANDLDASLASLDRELEAKTAGWKERAFVPFTTSFAYYAERYHLEMRPPIEAKPGAPPDDAASAAIAASIKSRPVRALFREPQLAAAPVESIAQGAHVPVSVLDPLGGGTTETDSYEELLRFDTDALGSALR